MKLLITDYKLSIFILLGGGVRPAKIRKKWDLSASMHVGVCILCCIYCRITIAK